MTSPNVGHLIQFEFIITEYIFLLAFGVMAPQTTDLVKRPVEACCLLLLIVEGNNAKRMVQNFIPEINARQFWKVISN
jgi:hypothetical protein